MEENNTKRLWSIAFTYFRIALGGAIYAAGIEWFFTPVELISGGVTGVSMIINLIAGFPVGILIVIINIPLFIFALRIFGFRFMFGSIIGMLTSSLFIDLFSQIRVSTLTTDPFLAALFGGLVTGLGIGLIFSADATSGGVDVLATIIRRKYPYINISTLMLALDAIVIISYALIFRFYEKAMYTVIAVFVASKVIDIVLYGTSQSKLCHIISEHSDKIKAEIVSTLNRGVTMLHGTGAYSGQEKQILLCVVKRQQIVEIRKIIKSIDQRAFVIVTDTRDVFGEGFGNLMSDSKLGN